MLPGIYGFHFDAGHMIFLGAFYSAILLILATVARSFWRAQRDLTSGRASRIQWREEFHELPRRSRSCRHELTGEVADRECPHAFDCRECADHHQYAPAGPASGPRIEVLGIPIPLDRRYHRGHTWVRGERDGTFTIGLDGLISRLIGTGMKPELPVAGERLEVNAEAFPMVGPEGNSVRILAPMDAVVLETCADGSQDWLLRVQAHSDGVVTHLLSGGEVESWMRREVERLQAALMTAGVGVAVADGGVMTENPGAAYPQAAWVSAVREMALEG